MTDQIVNASVSPAFVESVEKGFVSRDVSAEINRLLVALPGKSVDEARRMFLALSLPAKQYAGGAVLLNGTPLYFVVVDR